MLKMKFQRIGRANDPHFRVVVIEAERGPKSGNFVEEVGAFNPKNGEVRLKAERIKHWLTVGVKPSATVHNLLVSERLLDAPKIHVSRVKPKEETKTQS